MVLQQALRQAIQIDCSSEDRQKNKRYKGLKQILGSYLLLTTRLHRTDSVIRWSGAGTNQELSRIMRGAVCK